MRVALVRSVVMMVLVTVVAGFAYPLLVTGVSVAVFPHRAEGSLLYRHGRLVGSALLGQRFTDARGDPLPRYFQPRPSAAGAGYDATASGATNLGPSNPLLVGFVAGRTTFRQDGTVAPTNPFATAADPTCVPLDPAGDPVAVVNPGPHQRFARSHGTYACDPDTVPERAMAYRAFNGLAPDAVVPVDAVTASGSGLDPDISLDNARDQTARVARARHEPASAVAALVRRYTDGPQLGFLGDQVVDVVQLNLALDEQR